MSRSILVTGATGAVGPSLLTELVRTAAFDRIVVLSRTAKGIQEPGRFDIVTGDIRLPNLGFDRSTAARIVRETDVIVHAAANTRFTAPLAELHDDNVLGTNRVLELAAGCRRLRQFLLVSSTCVAGTRTGVIAERVEDEPPAVVNPYEHTKWLAEQAAVAAGVPLRIARLSICTGDSETGVVHRTGALHQALRWFAAGLLPLIPGIDESRLDLIPTNVAARWLARAATRPIDGLDVCHVAAGAGAISLNELVDFLIDVIERRRAGKARPVERPVLVDARAFKMFERMVFRSGDARFGRVIESMQSFLPVLLFPKVYETERAEACWGGALPIGDWRTALGNVMSFVLPRTSRLDRVRESLYA